MIYLFILIAVLHILDMLFTVLYIGKMKKYYTNAEIIEFNYHKYFFKRFGLYKGSIISVMISLPVILSLTYLSLIYFENLVYIIIGINFGVMYVNFVSYINFDDTRNKLKLRG